MFRNRAFRSFLLLLVLCALLNIDTIGWLAILPVPIAIGWSWRHTDHRLAGVMLSLILLILFSWNRQRYREHKLDTMVGSPVILNGLLLRSRQEDRYLSGQVAFGVLRNYRGDLLYLGGMPFTVSGHPEKKTLSPGSVIRVTGILRLRRVYLNPGSDRTAFYRARGLRYNVSVPAPPLLQVRSNALSFLSSPYDRLVSTLDPLHLALLKAMTSGNRDDLPILFRDRARRLGIYHLFVVSGFHFGLFFAAVLSLLMLFPIRQRWRKAVALLVITGLLPITAFSPAAVRAWLMISIYLLFNRKGIHVPPLDAVGLAGILLLVLQPAYALDPGFLFSFLVTGGIVSSLTDTDRWWQVFLKVPFFAFVFSLPVAVIWFHRVALLAPFINLIITVPVIGQIYLFLGTLLHLPVARPLDWLLGGTIRLLGWFPDPAPLFRLPAWLAPIAFAPLAGWWFLTQRRMRLIALAGGSLLLLFVARVPWPLRDGIYVPDTAQSQAVLVRVQGHNWLVDCGGEWEARLGLIPWLESLGIQKLSGVFLSHFDADHAGGLPELMDRIPVEHLYLPYLDHSRNACRVLSRSDTRMVSRTLLSRNGRPEIHLPGITISVLHPGNTPRQIRRANDASLVMLWDLGTISVLFPGDLDGSELARLVPRLPHADLLIAPHHGSRRAAVPGLRESVQPNRVIVCCGRRNRFHFPSKVFLNQFDGIPVFTTAESGEIRILLAKPDTIHHHAGHL